MTLAAVLLLYAILTAAVAPAVLRRARWLSKSPRLGILAWQGILAGVLSALVLLLAVAAMPTSALSFDVNHLLHACVVRLSDLYARGDVGVAHVLAIVVGAGTLIRLSWVLALQVRETAHQRSAQRTLLALVAGGPGPDGTVLLPADVPVAYCVPGQGGRIVLTTAAAHALNDEERSAVIAHERAHLQGRHDLVLLGANVAAAALPWLPLFQDAKQSLARYVEMLADDAAVRLSGPMPIAAALLGLGAPGSSATLGASGTATAERIMRLLDDDTGKAGPARRFAFGTAAICAAGLPMAVVTAPVLASALGLCPIA